MFEKILLKNIVFSFLGRGWNIILSLIITPYVIAVIGVEQFGVWVLMESIVAYFVLLDMGFGTSFNKYIAGHYTKKEYVELSNVYTTGILFYLIFSLLIITVSISLQNWLIERFNFGKVSYKDVSAVYLALILILSIRSIISVFTGIITGLLQYDVVNKIKIASSTINFIGIYIFLSLGYGLKGLALNGIIYAVLDLAVYAAAAYKLVPHLKFRVHKGLKESFTPLFKFGITMQVVSIAELINEQIDKILLGVFRTVSLVGMYEVGTKIANTSNLLPAIILPILNPTASTLDALNKKEELGSLYIKGTNIIAMVTIPIAVMVIVYAEHIVSFWMGRTDLTEVAIAARFLIIGVTLYLIVGVGRFIARGIGVPHYEMQTGLLIAISNGILSYFMIVKWGLYGAVLASSATLSIGSIFFLLRFNREMHLPQKSIFAVLIKILLFSVISAGLSLVLSSFYNIYSIAPISLRMRSFIHLLSVFTIGAAIYISLLYLSGMVKGNIKPAHNNNTK